jgi:hypothetical protein
VSVASSLSLSSLRRGLLRIFFASVSVVVALEERGWIWGVCVFCGHLMWLDKRFLFKLFFGFLWIYIFDFCLTTGKKKKIACQVFFLGLLFRDSFLPSFHRFAFQALSSFVLQYFQEQICRQLRSL